MLKYKLLAAFALCLALVAGIGCGKTNPTTPTGEKKLGIQRPADPNAKELTVNADLTLSFNETTKTK